MQIVTLTKVPQFMNLRFRSVAFFVIAGMLFAVQAVAAQVPQRIVSTAPSVTETLFALGLGERVVGITTYCNYPDAAKNKTRIGTYLQPNLEVILSLKPDLVIVVKNPVQLADKFSRAGLNVLELGEETLSGIAESISRIGEAAGVRDRAHRLNQEIKAQLTEIEEKTKTLPRRSMMFIVSRTPGRLEALMAVGQATYLNELIHIAGGENIFGKTNSSYPKISLEEVLSRNPDVIVDMGEMSETQQVTEAQKRAVVSLWKRQRSLQAVRNDRVFAVASDIFVVAGPRAVDAARAFAAMLHPELTF